MNRLRYLLISLSLLVTGCGQLETEYGVMYGRSINGIDAFAALLRRDGHRVGVTRKLSPKVMYLPDVLVLFQADFTRLPEEERRWLESWLGAYEGRQLVLILRDTDEEIAYWDDMLEREGEALDPETRGEIETRRELAVSALQSATKQSLPRKWPEWYGQRAVEPWLRRADAVTGPAEWTSDVGLKQGELDLRFARRLVPGSGARSIVKAGDDVLIAKRPLREGEIWLVANGSFLLNYGLVNHEHRKLALALSRQLGREREILFVLNTTITDQDEEEPLLGMYQFLVVGPIPWIAAHLMVVALAYSWLSFPIFGRPQEKPSREVYRFARHVDALGKMLGETRDAEAAEATIARYRALLGKKSRD